jgi:hypothetical protein
MPSNDLPFYLIRNTVYDINELLSGFDLADSTSFARTRDSEIYAHFVAAGGAASEDRFETMMQALHDNSITHAVIGLLRTKPKVVAIMGGYKDCLATCLAGPYAAAPFALVSLILGPLRVAIGRCQRRDASPSAW